MIIDIQSTYINNNVCSILGTFKILTEKDLLGILPTAKRNAAVKILNSLVKSKFISKKEIDGEYYFFFFSGKKEYGYMDYLIYKQSLAFLRIILADEENVPFVLYKISMPFLLPNRRSNFTLFKDTIATTIYYEVDNFCKTNNIEQIKYAAVAIVTSINNDNNVYLSDNDNKEYATGLNILGL